MPEIDPVTMSADPLQDLILVQCCCRKIALVHHIDHKGKKQADQRHTATLKPCLLTFDKYKQGDRHQ